MVIGSTEAARRVFKLQYTGISLRHFLRFDLRRRGIGWVIAAYAAAYLLLSLCDGKIERFAFSVQVYLRRLDLKAHRL